MLLLASTTDKIQLTTSAAADIDVHASFMDHTTSTDDVVGSKQNTAITTATTTDIVAAPGSGVVRNVKTLHICNKDASDSCDVTVIYDANGTDYRLHKATLRPDEALEYVEGIGFYTIELNSDRAVSYSKLTSDLALSTSTTLANTGPSFNVLAGVYYMFRFLLLYQTAATTTGIKTSVTIPAASRFAAWVQTPVSTAAGGTANVYADWATTSGDAVTGTGTPAANVDHFATLEGLIVPSADGTLALQHASEVTTTGVTVRSGTMGRLEVVV